MSHKRISVVLGDACRAHVRWSILYGPRAAERSDEKSPQRSGATHALALFGDPGVHCGEQISWDADLYRCISRRFWCPSPCHLYVYFTNFSWANNAGRHRVPAPDAALELRDPVGFSVRIFALLAAHRRPLSRPCA